VRTSVSQPRCLLSPCDGADDLASGKACVGEGREVCEGHWEGERSTQNWEEKRKKRLTYSNLHDPALSCADVCAGSEQAVCRQRVARPVGP